MSQMTKRALVQSLKELLTELLYAFPMREMRVFLPAWVQALEYNNPMAE